MQADLCEFKTSLVWALVDYTDETLFQKTKKQNQAGCREMARLLKCLPCEIEDPCKNSAVCL